MTRRVLHILPHAGAGAQTYIDILASLEGYAFEVVELTASRSPGTALASIAARQPRLARAAATADLIHVHGEVASAIALPWLAARPSVVTFHGLHLLRRLAPGMPRRLGRVNLRAIVACSRRAICVSEAERADLAWLPQRLASRLVVVRNGLELPPAPSLQARRRARSELALEDEAVAVLYVGQLEERKDPLTAVRAVQRARKRDDRVVLLVAGDGPCAASLESYAGAGVRLLGQRLDVGALLAAADVFVMPSLREGLSYAVLEAMGHCVATVVSDAPGNPEAVRDAGLVFPTHDERALAQILLNLAAHPQHRAALGIAGRERIAVEMSADRMRRETRAVYESVLTAPDRVAGARAA